MPSCTVRYIFAFAAIFLMLITVVLATKDGNSCGFSSVFCRNSKMKINGKTMFEVITNPPGRVMNRAKLTQWKSEGDSSEKLTACEFTANNDGESFIIDWAKCKLEKQLPRPVVSLEIMFTDGGEPLVFKAWEYCGNNVIRQADVDRIFKGRYKFLIDFDKNDSKRFKLLSKTEFKIIDNSALPTGNTGISAKVTQWKSAKFASEALNMREETSGKEDDKKKIFNQCQFSVNYGKFFINWATCLLKEQKPLPIISLEIVYRLQSGNRHAIKLRLWEPAYTDKLQQIIEGGYKFEIDYNKFGSSQLQFIGKYDYREIEQ